LKGVQEVIRSLDMTKVPLAPAVVSGSSTCGGKLSRRRSRRRLELAPRPADMLP